MSLMSGFITLLIKCTCISKIHVCHGVIHYFVQGKQAESRIKQIYLACHHYVFDITTDLNKKTRLILNTVYFYYNGQ